ncbi:MAG: putative alpha-1,2-mannosidase, partial [Cognaticolwellia sp.]
FTIIANNRTVDGNNKTNIYIQSAKFNGKSLNKLALTHSQIVAGGTLELEMAAQPNKSLK